MVTVHREEAEGSETHEMDILVHHTSSVAGSLRSPVSTGHDIGNKAQPVVVSQAEGVTTICWCLIPRQLSFSVTGSNISEINIDQSRSRDDVSHTNTSDRPIQTRFEGQRTVEELHGARFLMILEISMA